MALPHVVVADSVKALKKAETLALQNKTYQATEALYQGLLKLGNHSYSDTLFYQMTDILTNQEKDAYKNNSNRGLFLLDAWKRRDITPATFENERYVEHMHRLNYARTHFHSRKPRGYDERGRIWICYGTPDDRVVMPSHFHLYPNEGWIYRRFSAPVVIDFIKRFSEYSIKFPGERLSPLGMGSLEAQIDYYELRAGFDPGYSLFLNGLYMQRTVDKQDHLAGNAAESNPFNQNHRIWDMQLQFMTLPQVISSLTAVPTLPTEIQIARFYREGQTRLEAYWGVPVDALEPIDKGSHNAQFRLSGRIYDQGMKLYDEVDQQGEIPLGAVKTRTDRRFTSQVNFTLPPGPSKLAFLFADGGSERAFQDELRIEGFPAAPKQLFMSDLQLATSVGPVPETLPESLRPYVKGDLLVRPLSKTEIDKSRPLHLYFEAYNLTLNGQGQAKYKMTYKVKSEKGFLGRLFSGGGTAISSSFQQNTTDRTMAYHLAVDLKKLKPGRYRVEIHIEDLTAGTKTQTERRITVI